VVEEPIVSVEESFVSNEEVVEEVIEESFVSNEELVEEKAQNIEDSSVEKKFESNKSANKKNKKNKKKNNNN